MTYAPQGHLNIEERKKEMIMSYVAKKPDHQGNVDYTQEENETWSILYHRQIKRIENRACQEFIQGLNVLNMRQDRIPQCPEMTEKLFKATGWAMEPVAKIISLETFFDLLSRKHFPAATFIRTREDLDYLKEPDIFHEFFGHGPLLTNPYYAKFVQRYGELALKASKEERSILGRLFWFTIEFGLIKEGPHTRIMGGGILSSFEETVYALENPNPQRVPFNIRDVMKEKYRYDQIQKKYFILQSFDELFSLTQFPLLELAQKVMNQTDCSEDFIICKNCWR
jgi:phenylalanine-4-hydroxylase